MAAHDERFEALLERMRVPGTRALYVTGPGQVYLENAEGCSRINGQLPAGEDVESLARHLASKVGRRANGSRPFMHFRLADGKRVAIARPAGALNPAITVSNL